MYLELQTIAFYVIMELRLSYLMTENCSGENLPLPEQKHIEIRDRGETLKVHNNVILTFKVAEYHFKSITSVPPTRINYKGIVFTLIKNPFIHENMSKARSKSTDTIKKEIALNHLEDLLPLLYISEEISSCERPNIKS